MAALNEIDITEIKPEPPSPHEPAEEPVYRDIEVPHFSPSASYPSEQDDLLPVTDFLSVQMKEEAHIPSLTRKDSPVRTPTPRALHASPVSCVSSSMATGNHSSLGRPNVPDSLTEPRYAYVPHLDPRSAQPGTMHIIPLDSLELREPISTCRIAALNSSDIQQHDYMLGIQPSTSCHAAGHPVTKQNRKRRAQPDTWKRNERKIKRMSGKSYVNRRNVLVPEKKPQHIDCSRCRFKCSDAISIEWQNTLHREYWSLADADRQKAHLCSLVTENSVGRHRKRNPDSVRLKGKSRVYTLPAEHGKNVRVCLKFMCATYSISFQVIDLALKNRGTGGAYIGCDGRKGLSPPNVTPIEARTHVKNHIDMFPRMELHHCRRDTKKFYLAADLNISVMYKLYVETYCPKASITPVSINVYRSMFHSYEPPLSLHIPKKHQCATCNRYHSAVDKTDMEDSWQLHMNIEQEAMDMKEKDKKEALEDNGVTCRAITFDLQANLTVPFSADTQIHYKRKLSVFNFTIFDSFDQNGQCFVWDETHGTKGASEIGSCLLKYVYSLPQTVVRVSSFSDTWGGQNRNQFVSAAMLYAVNKIDHLQTVDLKFMESGHSNLEADSIHATVERARKSRKIYTAEEWGLLIEMARKKPRPYNVTMLSFSDICDLQALASRIMINTKTNTLKDRVKWPKIKWLRFAKSKPFVIQYKYALNDAEFLEFNVLHSKRKKSTISWNTVALSQKYGERLPISESKKKDLLQLLQEQVIPEAYKNYIERIPSSDNSTDYVPWVTGESEDEDRDEGCVTSLYL